MFSQPRSGWALAELLVIYDYEQRSVTFFIAAYPRLVEGWKLVPEGFRGPWSRIWGPFLMGTPSCSCTAPWEPFRHWRLVESWKLVHMGNRGRWSRFRHPLHSVTWFSGSNNDFPFSRKWRVNEVKTCTMGFSGALITNSGSVALGHVIFWHK